MTLPGQDTQKGQRDEQPLPYLTVQYRVKQETRNTVAVSNTVTLGAIITG